VKDLAAAAETLVGTRFHWHGRSPGVGVDCAGVIVCSIDMCGYDRLAEPRYTKCENLDLALAWLGNFAKRVPGHSSIHEGDILIWEIEPNRLHAGIAVGDSYFVHADTSPGVRKVVKVPLTDDWISKIAFVYRVGG